MVIGLEKGIGDRILIPFVFIIFTYVLISMGNVWIHLISPFLPMGKIAGNTGYFPLDWVPLKEWRKTLNSNWIEVS